MGRTREPPSAGPGLDAVWREIQAGVGRSLNRHAMHFGHPACNITVPVIVVNAGCEHCVIEVVREDKKWDLRVAGRVRRRALLDGC